MTPERGSSLIISMIVLIIMMLLGVTAINSSGTQFKLAANLQFENMALNNAETAVKSVERLLETLPSTVSAPAASSVASLPDPLAMAWTDADSIQVVAGDDDQRYVIGFVGTQASPLAGIGLDCTDPGNEKNYDCVNTYLITARGQGQRGAVKFIQTYYAVPLR